jgi:hypothetical protein
MLELIARLGLNSTAYEAGLNRASATAQRWGLDLTNRMKGWLTAGLTMGGVLTAFRSTMDHIKAMTRASQELSVPIELLQTLDWAARKSGLGFEVVTDALEKFEEKLGQAALGRRRPLKLMQALGLTPEQIKSGDIGAILQQLNRQLQTHRGDFATTQLLESTFGRRFLRLLQQDFGALRGEAERTGYVWDRSLNESMLKFRQQWMDLNAYLRGPIYQAMLMIGKVVDRIVRGLGLILGGVGAGARAAGEFSGTKAGAAGTAQARQGLRRFLSGDPKSGLADILGGTWAYWRDLLSASGKGVWEEWTRQVEAWQQAKQMEPEKPVWSVGTPYLRTRPDSTTLLQGSLTAAQRVGAYIAVPPLVSELRRANEQLAQINEAVSDMAESLDTIAEE